MIRDQGGRPFYSYVVTQSALVLIVLAASYLATDLLEQYAGIAAERMWVSLALLLTAQLPVAALYARNETAALSSGQGWALATVFCCCHDGFRSGVACERWPTYGNV